MQRQREGQHVTLLSIELATALESVAMQLLFNDLSAWGEIVIGSCYKQVLFYGCSCIHP